MGLMAAGILFVAPLARTLLRSGTSACMASPELLVCALLVLGMLFAEPPVCIMLSLFRFNINIICNVSCGMLWRVWPSLKKVSASIFAWSMMLQSLARGLQGAQPH